MGVIIASNNKNGWIGIETLSRESVILSVVNPLSMPEDNWHRRSTAHGYCWSILCRDLFSKEAQLKEALRALGGNIEFYPCSEYEWALPILRQHTKFMPPLSLESDYTVAAVTEDGIKLCFRMDSSTTYRFSIDGLQGLRQENWPMLGEHLRRFKFKNARTIAEAVTWVTQAIFEMGDVEINPEAPEWLRKTIFMASKLANIMRANKEISIRDAEAHIGS